MTWKTLDSISQVSEIADRSHHVPCLIFKHSTSCPISSIAKHRLEGDWPFSAEEMECFYLDLLSNRAVSNAVAEQLAVHHESPQAILLSKGVVIFDASHLSISAGQIQGALAANEV